MFTKINKSQANRKKEFDLLSENTLHEAIVKWRKFILEYRFILAYYQHRNQKTVDVLKMLDADINGKKQKTVTLVVLSPTVVGKNDGYGYLDWTKELILPINNLFYMEPLHLKFDDDGKKNYQIAVKHGLEIAHRLWSNNTSSSYIFPNETKTLSITTPLFFRSRYVYSPEETREKKLSEIASTFKIFAKYIKKIKVTPVN